MGMDAEQMEGLARMYSREAQHLKNQARAKGEMQDYEGAGLAMKYATHLEISADQAANKAEDLRIQAQGRRAMDAHINPTWSRGGGT